MTAATIASVTFTTNDLAPGVEFHETHRKQVEEAMTAAGFGALENMGYTTEEDE